MRQDVARQTVRLITAVAGIVLVTWGLLTEALPWERLRHLSIDVLRTLLPILLIAGLLARWSRMSVTRILLILGLALPAVWLVGLPALLAVLLLSAASLALGSLFNVEGEASPWIHLLLGAAIIAAIAGWLLPFRIHLSALWIVALSILIWGRRRALLLQLTALRLDFESGLQHAPRSTFFGVAVLVVAASPAWLPISMHDDLSYHLGIGTQLLEFGHARFNVGAQVWALAPWASDVLHAIAMVVAGGEVNGCLNVIWLIATVMLVRRLALQFDLAHSAAWLVAALYVSLPLSSALTTSFQTETLTAAIMVALANLGLQSNVEPRRPLVVAVLAGLLLATKISAAAMGAPLLLWLAWQSRRSFTLRGLVLTATLGLFVAGSSYTYAALLTGNPLLPLYNGVFQSPWFALENFRDPLWDKGFGDFLPWGLVFSSGQYAPGPVGVAGLVPLALLGGSLLALGNARTRWLAVTAAAGFLLMFSQMQYLRYVHPLMAILVPVSAVGMLQLGRFSRTMGWVLWAVVALQLYLVPTAYWVLFAGGWHRFIGETREAFLEIAAPTRLAIARFKEVEALGDRVLFTDSGYTATLPGRAMGVDWYSQDLSRHAANFFDIPQVWRRVVDEAGSNYLITTRLSEAPGLRQYLAERGAIQLGVWGVAELFQLPPVWQSVSVVNHQEQHEAIVPLPDDEAVLGTVMLEAHCSQPGQNVSIGWEMRSETSTEKQRSMQRSCPPDGRLQLAMRFVKSTRVSEIRVVAGPTAAQEPQRLSEVAVRAETRPHWLYGRELYLPVLEAFCLHKSCDKEALQWQFAP
jgi:hypothetical protein